jgi:hypothetical protein
MTFILLFTYHSFGQSVLDADLNSIPPNTPHQRNVLLQERPDLLCTDRDNARFGCDPACLGRESSLTGSAEMVGDLHV